MATTGAGGGSSTPPPRRRLTLPEGADYVPMFGYDSDGELVVISPSRRGSAIRENNKTTDARQQIGGNYPRGSGKAFTREDSRRPQIGQSYPRDGREGIVVKQNNRESLATEYTQMKTTPAVRKSPSKIARKEQVAAEPAARNVGLQSLLIHPDGNRQGNSSAIGPAEAFEVVSAEDLSVEDNVRESPPPPLLTRDNLTGLAMNSVASSSASGPSAPLTESDIRSAETARGERRSDYGGVIEDTVRVVKESQDAAGSIVEPIPESFGSHKGRLLRPFENNKGASQRSYESLEGASWNYSGRDDEDLLKSSESDEGTSLKSTGKVDGAFVNSSGKVDRAFVNSSGKVDGALVKSSGKVDGAFVNSSGKADGPFVKSFGKADGAFVKSFGKDEEDSRRSSRNAEATLLTPFEMVEVPQLSKQHPIAADLSHANLREGRLSETPLEHRDRRLKKALEGLRKSLAASTDLRPTRRCTTETSSRQVAEPSGPGMITRDLREPSVASEEWIDGRVEEQRHEGMEEVLVDTDATGYQYIGGEGRASSRGLFETELALEDAVLRKLSPLKRVEGKTEEKIKSRPSVGELMAEIERARDMTRHIEKRRVSVTRTEPVGAAGRPMHIAKVEADWTALRPSVEPPSTFLCQKCGASPTTLQGTSGVRPGANKADEKACSPNVDERRKGDVLPAYVWPLPTWMPPVSREDTKLVMEESPGRTVRPVLPIPAMSRDSTVAYKERPMAESVGVFRSKEVDISPKKPTQDRSIGDYRVTVSTVETQTPPPPMKPVREDQPSSTLRGNSPRPAREHEEGYHEVLRDRLWRSVSQGSSNHHSRENVVLVDGKIVSYNRETDPPPGHGRDIPRIPDIQQAPVQNPKLRDTEVVSGPPVHPRVTTVNGNDHLVYAYRARVASCDYLWAGGFLRVGFGNTSEIVWSSPVAARIRWEVGDIITVVGVARPAPREIVVRLNNTFILDRTSTTEFPIPDNAMDLIPYVQLGSGIARIDFPP